jgi:tetratricopeptide (TPR) repeat protein
MSTSKEQVLDAYVTLALAYDSAGNSEQAIPALLKALEIDPTYPRAALTLGIIYNQEERFQDAANVLRRALEKSKGESDAELRAAIYMNLGIALNGLEQHEEAVAMFREAQRLGQKETVEFCTLFGESLYLIEYAEEEALEMFDRAIALDDTYARAWVGRAEVLQWFDRFPESIGAFDKALKHEPDSAWALVRKGDVLSSMERFEDALRCYESAINIEPAAVANAVAEQAERLFERQRYEQALPLFDMVLAGNEKADAAYYYRALAHHLIGQKGGVEQDLKSAIKIAEETYHKTPQNWENTFNLALYYLTFGDVDKAMHVYEEALKNKVSASRIRDAIQNVSGILTLFPEYPKDIGRWLEKELEERLNGNKQGKRRLKPEGEPVPV